MKHNWSYSTIGVELKTSSGGTPNKMHKEFYEGGNIPWLRSGEVCKKNITETEMFITQKGMDNSSAKWFPENTVLVAMYGATAGQVGILRFPSTTNQAICGIFPNDKFLPEFLYYTLLYRNDTLVSQAVGNAQPNISQIKVKEVPLPKISIEEQQKIVEFLDKEFEKIDTLKANAEKGLQQAKDLFQSALKQELQPKEGWTTKRIGELSEDLFAGGDVPRESFSKTQNDDYNIPIYANAVENNGLYGYTNRARVIKPSITIAGRGSGTGYVIERNESYFPVVRLIVVIPNEFVLNKYLYYALKALNIKSNGSAIPQLTVPMIAQYKINFPKSLDEQNTIICLLDRISEYCKTLQANYEKTIALCDDMKQVLLRKAFNGEL